MTNQQTWHALATSVPNNTSSRPFTTQRGRPFPYLLAHSDSRRSATVSPAGMTITSEQELRFITGQPER